MNCRNAFVAVTVIMASVCSGATQAALVDRGGGLIYDTDLNVTWLQDANYAKTSGYSAYGLMTWSQAVTWAENLSYYDNVRNVTYADWRLPTTTDTGAPGCDFGFSGKDCGYNVNPASSEMAHLHFTELGNLSRFTTTGTLSGAMEGGANPNSAQDNTGPFINFQPGYYWSGTEYALYPSEAWSFYPRTGEQDTSNKSFYRYYALAVRPGDVAAVPEAETYALMLVGLGLVAWHAKRRA